MVFKESGLGIRAEGLLSRNSGSAILPGPHTHGLGFRF